MDAAKGLLRWGLGKVLGERLDDREHWGNELMRRLGGEDAAADAADECPICFSAPVRFVVSPCGHGLCKACAVGYLRAAVGDANAQVLAAGVRCPLHSAGCVAHIQPTDAVALLSAADARRAS